MQIHLSFGMTLFLFGCFSILLLQQTFTITTWTMQREQRTGLQWCHRTCLKASCGNGSAAALYDLARPCIMILWSRCEPGPAELSMWREGSISCRWVRYICPQKLCNSNGSIYHSCCFLIPVPGLRLSSCAGQKHAIVRCSKLIQNNQDFGSYESKLKLYIIHPVRLCCRGWCVSLLI